MCNRYPQEKEQINGAEEVFEEKVTESFLKLKSH